MTGLMLTIKRVTPARSESRSKRGKCSRYSKKTPGRPKLSRGVCGLQYGRRHVLDTRRRGRELNRLACLGHDPEGDLVEGLAARGRV